MIRYSVRAAAIGALTISLAGPASAEWLKARSRHFLIYSPGSEKNLRTFTDRLEQLDAALRVISNMPDREGVESNPVTIFMTPKVEDIRVLYGDPASLVAGFYIPRSSGSVAFTPLRLETRAIGSDDNDEFSPTIVLYHEYGHHFMLGNFTLAYPAWFSEGYAEVISTARFDKDTVTIGAPANHRASSLLHGELISVSRLLSLGRGAMTGEEMDSLYARGWLLTHYVMFSPAHNKQFDEYLKLINEGTSSLKAAEKAFGDLKALDRDLDRYLGTRLRGLTVKLGKDQQSPVTITPVGDGGSAMIPSRMWSMRGIDKDRAAKVFASAGKIGARYPTDALVQGWLAEMAFDTGNLDAAEAAADAALATDPKSIQALLYKARVLLQRAGKTKVQDAAAWRAARGWIVKANVADRNNAAALALYYESFGMQGIEPTAAAIDGLHRAFDLVPQDSTLRFRTARQDVMDDDIPLAIQTLRPLAYSPHGGGDSAASQLIANLSAGKSGPEALAAFDAAVAKAAKEAKEKDGNN